MNRQIFIIAPIKVLASFLVGIFGAVVGSLAWLYVLAASGCPFLGITYKTPESIVCKDNAPIALMFLMPIIFLTVAVVVTYGLIGKFWK